MKKSYMFARILSLSQKCCVPSLLAAKCQTCEKRKFRRTFGQSSQEQGQGNKGPRLIDVFSSAGGSGGGMFEVSSMT
jgi:hypothetical protein